jgi:hypothetical protein
VRARKLIGATVVLALAMAGVAGGKAGTGDHHRFDLTFTAKDELKSTGLHLVSTRIDGATQPATAVRRIEVTLPAGTKTNVNAVFSIQQCSRSTLLGRGPGGCPKAEIGDGEATLTTGKEDIRVFVTYDFDQQTSGHQKGAFLYMTERRQLIPVAIPRGGRTMTVEVPQFCRDGYDQTATQCKSGEAFLTELDFKIKRRTRKSASGRKTILVRTPRKCPRSKKWKSKAVYSFRTGADESVKSSTSCRRD